MDVEAGTPTERTCDLVVLGSGAAALATAVTAAELGLSVTVLERDALIGGTSAISGAAAWIPGSRQAIAAGLGADVATARIYLQNVLGDAFRPELVDNFLARGGEALAFLEDRGGLAYSLRALGPDYYPEIEGATDAGRVLDVAEFDGRKLGAWVKRLRPGLRGFTLFGGMMLDRNDVAHLMRFRSSPRSFLHSARRIARYALDRLTYGRATRLTLGGALVGRLLHAALTKGVTVETRATTQRFLLDGDRVAGVEYRDAQGRSVRLLARAGVVLGTGGFGRAAWAPGERPDTGEDHLSLSAPLADGAMADMAKGLGARFGGPMNGAFHWAPMSKAVDTDGRVEVFPHIVTDRAKPGVIAVNADAERFVNEGNSYHRFVHGMLEEQRQGRTRFFLLTDAKGLGTYGLGLARPAPGDNSGLLRSGYLIRADSIEALGRKLELDPQRLAATVAEHNGFAAAGRDLRFGKGDSSYNKALGDMTAPHPGLAPIATPPYYAVRLHTGDLGPAKGLYTDVEARVQREDGSTIAGLYAVGNDMNSVMGGCYPGPGITIGPALTFGYLAARAAAQDVATRTNNSGRTGA